MNAAVSKALEPDNEQKNRFEQYLIAINNKNSNEANTLRQAFNSKLGQFQFNTPTLLDRNILNYLCDIQLLLENSREYLLSMIPQNYQPQEAID
jgi:hypothetical protein